jgi:hypothetical protein
MAEKHTHYRDYRDIRGDGRIILYRRADIQSPNWTPLGVEESPRASAFSLEKALQLLSENFLNVLLARIKFAAASLI